MKRLLFSFITLIIWLTVFYNAERLNGSLHITPLAYLFALVVVLLTIAVRIPWETPSWALYAALSVIFLALRAGCGYPMGGAALPLTLIEVVAIATTAALGCEVGKRIREFEQAVAHITIGRPARRPAHGMDPARAARAEMYRELRRARLHQRPLSVIAVGVESETAWVAVDRIVHEMQSRMVEQYLLSRVAGILDEELEDHNIIAQNHNKFIVLLPEVTPDQSAGLAAQIKQIVSEEAGVNVRIGAASFPEDGATFDALLQGAVDRMSADHTGDGESGINVKVVEEKCLWS